MSHPHTEGAPSPLPPAGGGEVHMDDAHEPALPAVATSSAAPASAAALVAGHAARSGAASGASHGAVTAAAAPHGGPGPLVSITPATPTPLMPAPGTRLPPILTPLQMAASELLLNVPSVTSP